MMTMMIIVFPISSRLRGGRDNHSGDYDDVDVGDEDNDYDDYDDDNHEESNIDATYQQGRFPEATPVSCSFGTQSLVEYIDRIIQDKSG